VNTSSISLILKAKGQENRLENIAVRKVDIVDMGDMDGEPFVIIQFKANLLDYTVDEASGKVLEGSNSEPVKFRGTLGLFQIGRFLPMEAGGYSGIGLLDPVRAPQAPIKLQHTTFVQQLPGTARREASAILNQRREVLRNGTE
jgi:hypothetical protein